MSTVVMSAKEYSSNVKNNTKSLCEEIKKTFNVTPYFSCCCRGR